MIKLPDQNMTMVGLPNIVFPSKPALLPDWQVCNVNGLFTIIFRDSIDTGKLGIIQIFPDGSNVITSKFINPYGGSYFPQWFFSDGVLFSNKNLSRNDPGCAFTQFSYDLIDGHIIGARTGSYFGAYGAAQGNWCFGAINTGANYYPAFNLSTKRMYGNAWSSGESAGYAGSGSIYTDTGLSYKNYTCNNVNIFAFKDYWAQPGCVNSNSSPDGKTLVPWGNGYMVMSRGNGHIGQVPISVDILQLNVVTDSFRSNCLGNDLFPVIDKLSNINIQSIYPSYGLWYGPNFIFQPLQNTISCSVQCGNPLAQRVFLMDLQSNYIKQINLTGATNWNWYSWMATDGFVYSVWYDGNLTLALSRSTTTVDINYSVIVPARPGVPQKIPAIDTRVFYRSK